MELLLGLGWENPKGVHLSLQSAVKALSSTTESAILNHRTLGNVAPSPSLKKHKWWYRCWWVRRMSVDWKKYRSTDCLGVEDGITHTLTSNLPVVNLEDFDEVIQSLHAGPWCRILDHLSAKYIAVIKMNIKISSRQEQEMPTCIECHPLWTFPKSITSIASLAWLM